MRICPNCQAQNPSERYVYCGDCGAELNAAAPVEDPWIGRMLMDQWTIIEKVGVGGFGAVYKAKDRRGGIDAVKIFRRDALHPSDIEEARSRFEVEAELIKSLGDDCAQIVGLRAFTEVAEENLAYFVMEYVNGLNLHDLIESEGPFSVERVLDIGRQLAVALDVAHRNGVIHRDLKPANLMLTVDRGGHEVLKVLDFGVAKVLDEARRSKFGTTYLTPGTVGYASPEQQRPGARVDGRSDLYSASVVLYSLLAGKEPWVVNQITDRTSRGHSFLKMELASGEEIPLREFNRQVPRSLERLILKNLNAKPEDRLPDARAFLRELEKIRPPGDSHGLLRRIGAVPRPTLAAGGIAITTLAAAAVLLPSFLTLEIPAAALTSEASSLQGVRLTEAGVVGQFDRGVLPSRPFEARATGEARWQHLEALRGAGVRVDVTWDRTRLTEAVETLIDTNQPEVVPILLDSLRVVEASAEQLNGFARYVSGQLRQKSESNPQEGERLRAACRELLTQFEADSTVERNCGGVLGGRSSAVLQRGAIPVAAPLPGERPVELPRPPERHLLLQPSSTP